MTNKQLLLQLYAETVTLGRYIELEKYAKYPHLLIVKISRSPTDPVLAENRQGLH